MRISKPLAADEGFTLIELMIVVAIIGVLATIAIPNFIKFQLRSKSGESKTNLASIRTAEKSYYAEIGRYVDWSINVAGVHPAIPADPKQKSPWAPGCANPVNPATDHGSCMIGWRPEGDVYYSYNVSTNAANDAFFAEARSDIDGDATLNLWGLVQQNLLGVPAPNALGGFANAAFGCNDVRDTTDPTGASFLPNQVGPCNSVFNGREVF